MMKQRKGKKKMDEYEDNTTLGHSIYWLLAVEHQGARVIDAWKIEEGRHYPFLNTRNMEEHFFIIACNKAWCWVNKLKSIVEDDKPLRPARCGKVGPGLRRGDG